MTNEKTLSSKKHPSPQNTTIYIWLGRRRRKKSSFSMSMKGKDHTLMKAAASADLMVCFPSRSSLSLRPKAISHLPPHLKRTNARGFGVTMSSPLLRTPQTKQMGSENAEPTSPKVGCAGQIKAPSKSNKGGKSGQSLIEEIERIHNKGKKQRIHWLTSLGLKKEVGQLLSCLRGLRFDLRLRCLSNLPNASDDDEDENDGDGENNSNTLFSKWFMVLQENQNYDLCRRHKVSAESIAPPPNALLLMRCRSAPVRRLSAKEEEIEKCGENKDGGETARKLRCLMDEEKMKELEDEQTMKMKKKKECYVEMRETWFIARSKSWKR